MANPKLASAGTAVTRTVRSCSNCSAVYRSDFERCPTDGGPLQLSTTDPLIGQTLADTYVIDELIAEGAMGRVYRAHHKTLANQRYAIKVLLGDLAASATMRTRFAREAASASRLDHPNVVNVFDYGQTERGLHYLTMDLVEGCSLTSIIAEGPMAAERVIRIAHQLCEGLDHAHGRGVIHRDFKSDNILVVGGPGREIARIADFGLAMSKAYDVRLTVSGVACTPAYAAPEQLRGAAIDHRVDLYGLGATLFEMLSGGYLPFEGDMNTTVKAKLSCEAPSILTRAPNVPPGLVTLVGRLLAHDPDQRPRSARAVIRALETAMTLKMRALRTVEMPPLDKPAGTRRSRMLRGALLGIAIAALVIVARYRDRDDAPLPEAAAEPRVAPPAVVVESVTPVEPAPAAAPATEPPVPPPKVAPVGKRSKRTARKRVAKPPRVEAPAAPVVEAAPAEQPAAVPDEPAIAPPAVEATPALYEGR